MLSMDYSTFSAAPETFMLLSTAIISARMSRMGCHVLARTEKNRLGGGYLGHSLVVDVDELSRLRVDLEGLVEAQSGVDGVRGVLAHLLTTSDLGHKVLLGLLGVGGEAFGVGLVDSLADLFFLALFGGDSFVLGGLGDLLLLALERATEGRVGSPLVVKVDGVCEGGGGDGAEGREDDGRRLHAGRGLCRGHGDVCENVRSEGKERRREQRMVAVMCCCQACLGGGENSSSVLPAFFW